MAEPPGVLAASETSIPESCGVFGVSECLIAEAWGLLAALGG